MLKRLILVASFYLCCMLISAQIISFGKVLDLKDSAVATWSFEGNFKDMTDNGNDGKKLGETTFVASHFGKAISLSGKGDGVITPRLADKRSDGGTLVEMYRQNWCLVRLD